MKAALENLRTADPALNRFAAAVKQNLDQITGQTRNKKRLEPLPLDAPLADVVRLLNELVDRMQ